MTRLKIIPLAAAALVVSAGVALGFNAMPSAADDGLDRASDAADRDLPARPTSIDLPDQAPDTAPVTETEQVDPALLPDAASHGSDVSTFATGEDPTPDTNFGADVSAVARDNHGQETADTHRPADAGKPAVAGKPDGAGQPSDPGPPDEPGRP
jgi:hypothetical protein